MLDVARDVPVPEGAPITWHEGRGENLPFDDGAFDVVLCQQGLQFFTDRQAAVREMHRVLKPGGRAGVAVWRSPEHQSVKGALLLALQRWFGPGALVPYSFGDADAMRALFLDAGFREVELEVVRRQNLTPSVDEFITMTIRSASAAVPVLARATDKERADAIASIRGEIANEIAAVRVGEGLDYPMESHIVTARG